MMIADPGRSSSRVSLTYHGIALLLVKNWDKRICLLANKRTIEGSALAFNKLHGAAVFLVSIQIFISSFRVHDAEKTNKTNIQSRINSPLSTLLSKLPNLHVLDYPTRVYINFNEGKPTSHPKTAASENLLSISNANTHILFNRFSTVSGNVSSQR